MASPYFSKLQESNVKESTLPLKGSEIKGQKGSMPFSKAQWSHVKQCDERFKGSVKGFDVAFDRSQGHRSIGLILCLQKVQCKGQKSTSFLKGSKMKGSTFALKGSEVKGRTVRTFFCKVQRSKGSTLSL